MKGMQYSYSAWGLYEMQKRSEIYFSCKNLVGCRFKGILGSLSDPEKGKLQRSMGLKMEQLKVYLSNRILWDFSSSIRQTEIRCLPSQLAGSDMMIQPPYFPEILENVSEWLCRCTQVIPVKADVCYAGWTRGIGSSACLALFDAWGELAVQNNHVQQFLWSIVQWQNSLCLKTCWYIFCVLNIFYRLYILFQVLIFSIVSLYEESNYNKILRL